MPACRRWSGRSSPRTTGWSTASTRDSGKPLLANDPHLGFSAPSVWYLVAHRQPRRQARRRDRGRAARSSSSATTTTIAWGFTTTGGDVEDLFIEHVDPADAARYVTPEGSQPFVTREEAIRVSGADPVDPHRARDAPRAGDLRSRRLLCAARHGGKRAGAAGDVAGGGRPLAQCAVGDQPCRRLAGLPRRAQGLRRAAAEHGLCRCRRHISASSRRRACRSAPRAMAGCRRRAGPATTTGPASSRSTICRRRSTRLAAASSAPTTRSCPTATAISSARDWDLPNRAQRINELLDADAQAVAGSVGRRSRPTRCRRWRAICCR